VTFCVTGGIVLACIPGSVVAGPLYGWHFDCHSVLGVDHSLQISAHSLVWGYFPFAAGGTPLCCRGLVYGGALVTTHGVLGLGCTPPLVSPQTTAGRTMFAQEPACWLTEGCAAFGLVP